MNNKFYILIMIFIISSCHKIDERGSLNNVTISFTIDEVTKVSNENAIVECSIFQFEDNSGLLVQMQHVSSYDFNSPITLICLPGQSYDIYFVANAGDLTSKYIIRQTLVSELDTATYSFPREGLITYIPMSGKYSGSTDVDNIDVKMIRTLAKVSITINTTIDNDSEAIEIGKIRILNIPTRGSFFPVGSIYPASGASYMDYSERDIRIGETLEFYMPENKRGTNASITTESEKTINSMPSPYCSRAVISTGYRHYYYFDFGDLDIIFGENNSYDFNVNRNTHYEFSAQISDISDPRIRWSSSDNIIYYIENGENKGRGFFIFDRVWAQKNLGLDSDYPKGRYYLFGNGVFEPTIWNAGSSAKPIKTANDPCPPGWRVPSSTDFKFAWKATNGFYTHRPIWNNGTKYVSDYNVSDTIYFNPGGYYKRFNGSRYMYKTEGYYLCSDYSEDISSAYYVRFYKDGVSLVAYQETINYMFNIRCTFDHIDYLTKFHQITNN